MYTNAARLRARGMMANPSQLPYQVPLPAWFSSGPSPLSRSSTPRLRQPPNSLGLHSFLLSFLSLRAGNHQLLIPATISAAMMRPLCPSSPS